MFNLSGLLTVWTNCFVYAIVSIALAPIFSNLRNINVTVLMFTDEHIKTKKDSVPCQGGESSLC